MTSVMFPTYFSVKLAATGNTDVAFVIFLCYDGGKALDDRQSLCIVHCPLVLLSDNAVIYFQMSIF